MRILLTFLGLLVLAIPVQAGPPVTEPIPFPQDTVCREAFQQLRNLTVHKALAATPLYAGKTLLHSTQNLVMEEKPAILAYLRQNRAPVWLIFGFRTPQVAQAEGSVVDFSPTLLGSVMSVRNGRCYLGREFRISYDTLPPAHQRELDAAGH